MSCLLLLLLAMHLPHVCNAQVKLGQMYPAIIGLPSASELELTDEQKAKIKKSEEDTLKWFQNEFLVVDKLTADGKDDEARRYLIKLNNQSSERLNQGIWDVLVPAQQDKIFRLSFWLMANNSYGFGEQLGKNYASNRLELDSESKVKLKSKSDELQIEFSREVEKLREKYRKKLFDATLTSEQRQALKKLMSDKVVRKKPVVKF